MTVMDNLDASKSPKRPFFESDSPTAEEDLRLITQHERSHEENLPSFTQFHPTNSSLAITVPQDDDRTYPNPMNLSRDRRHESDDPDAYQIKIDGRAADALKRLKVPPRYLSPILCGSVVVVVLVAFLVGLVIPESGKDAGPLNVNLLVVGDWGRQGNYNQTDTAVRMASVSLSLNPSPLAVLSTGDNFYGNPDRLGGGGLFSTDDDNFYRSFKSVYARPGLMMPWYTILGNHDYGDGSSNTTQCTVANGTCTATCCFSALNQLSVNLRLIDPRWHCTRNGRKTFGARDEVEIFFFDTNNFVLDYYNRSWAIQPGGLSLENAKASLNELEAALHESSARWKIVMGHHPIYSSGSHGGTAELIAQVDPLLLKYGADLYINGHDHDQELITLNGMVYVTSGAGSKIRPSAPLVPGSIYLSETSGFLALNAQENQLRLDFYRFDQQAPDYTYTIVKRT